MVVATATALALVAAFEAAVAVLIHWLKRRCPWIITPADLEPAIDSNGLGRFLAHGWDPELGWVRKPGTAHDETRQGEHVTRYHIDGNGARRNPGFEGKPALALTYGDSYTFCRHVNDDETWPHVLSRMLGGCVANHGVGNYGLDQALLRLEREFDNHPAPVVIMGVVPETICRVLSSWKHFSEYGNILAFKPRFVCAADGDLTLLPNPADTPDKFFRIAEMLPRLKEQDFFFARKFAPDLLRFPYLWHLWRSRRRNLPLMGAALVDRLGGDGRHAFCRVMERNIDLTATLYRESEPLDLLVAITERFAAFTRSKGAVPVLVLLPQLYDLKRLRAGDHYYARFLERIAGTLMAVDFGPEFAADGDDRANYVDDRFGGHISARGNRLVAERLVEALPRIGDMERATRETLDSRYH